MKVEKSLKPSSNVYVCVFASVYVCVLYGGGGSISSRWGPPMWPRLLFFSSSSSCKSVQAGSCPSFLSWWSRPLLLCTSPQKAISPYILPFDRKSLPDPSLPVLLVPPFSEAPPTHFFSLRFQTSSSSSGCPFNEEDQEESSQGGNLALPPASPGSQ